MAAHFPLLFMTKHKKVEGINNCDKIFKIPNKNFI
uniref:Uncharacterized protein n=1 Tax=Rhizophora mucronata TaxID=61149 RepID=A0A2P2IMJ6_RHIMU